MNKFVSLLLTGAVSGGIYAIYASGLVLTYSTARIFNFAFGSIAFATAFVYYQLNTGLGLSVVPSALLCVGVFAPVMGFVLERAVFARLSRAPEFARIVGTIGILVALPNLCIVTAQWLRETVGIGLASEEQVYLPPGIGPTPPKLYHVTDGVVLSSDQVAVFLAAIIVAGGLWALMNHTRLGLNLRATVDRPDLAKLRGIDTSAVSTIGTVIGTVLAGLAGVLIAPLFSLDPHVFTSLMLAAAAGGVIKGFTSIPLAMVGGIVLGIVQSMVAGYVDFGSDLVPGLRSSVPFIVLFIGLLFLARDRSRRAGVTSDDGAGDSGAVLEDRHDLPVWRRAGPWTVATSAFVVWVLATSTFNAALAVKGVALGLVFLSFVVVTGIGGMVSLTQAAFVMAGAFTAAILLDHGVPFFLAALAGGAVAAGAGVIVALPSLRLGGLALSLATLAMGLMADQMIFQLDAVNGGSLGRAVSRPSLFGVDFDGDRAYTMLLLGVFAIVALGVRNLMRSNTGRAMAALRSSEVAAATSGASPVRLKFLLFGISAAIAGFGGALLGAVNPRVSPTDFTTPVGLVWVTVAILFGVRRPGSALIGGLAFVFTPEIISNVSGSAQLASVFFGLGAIQLAGNPDGLMSLRPKWLRGGRTTAAAPPGGDAARAAEGALEGTEAAGVEAPLSGMLSQRFGAAPASLELRGIVAGYGGIEVLHGIDLQVPRGSVVAVMGANGAGKSTLCAVAAGLVKPSAGSVTVAGQDVTTMRAHRRARTGLMVAPEYRGIFPGLSVQDNVAVWISDRRERDEALGRFDRLVERRHVAAGMLSGGEQQLLTLVSALARPPAVLIVDEPSLGLAPLITAKVFESLQGLREQGTTILLVEEKAADAMRLADFVVVLDRGRVRFAGRADEIDANAVQDLYLGPSALH